MMSEMTKLSSERAEKYACKTEPLFWNVFGKEHIMVEQFSNKNC